MQEINTFSCETYSINSTLKTPLCEFSLPKGEHAWYQESTQHLDKSTFAWESAVHKKKTTAMCREAVTVMVSLNNGRSCSNHNQCVSKNCLNGRCKGLELGEYCHQHSDCDAGFYCRQEFTWPFASKCNKANTNFEQCTDTY